MIKILLVEDEQEKKRLITECIRSADKTNLIVIDYADDVVSAKRQINSIKYDLMLLDINIPLRLGKSTERGAGLRVIDYLASSIKDKHMPAHILGMSAYDDGYSAAEETFKNYLWRLVKFSYTDNEWKDGLLLAVKQLIASHIPPYFNDGTSYHCDLGILVALDHVELNSVLELPANWQQVYVPHDPHKYYKGVFSREGKALSVVVVAASQMGLTAMAVTATKLISSFRPKHLSISGICAGVKTKTNYGDILVADPSWDWSSGKVTSKPKSTDEEFVAAPYQRRMNEQLRAHVKELAKDNDFLSNLKKLWHGNKPKNNINVLVDAVASGGSVLQRKKTIDKIVSGQHKNLIGVEMEIFAVFSAAEFSAKPQPLCFAAKSVCDFGDEKKNNKYQSYAAYTSANFIYEFSLRYLEPILPSYEE